MLLILVYHRIAEPGRDLYTVAPASFAAQLRQIGRCGLPVVDPQALPQWRGAGVLLSFDDGTAEHAQLVCPWLEQQGMRGLFLVPTRRLGQPGFLGPRQLERMHRAGHVIGSHGHSHCRLDRMPPRELAADLARSRAAIQNILGRPPMYVAPAGGFMSRRVTSACLAAGYGIIRTLSWGYNRNLDARALQAIPVVGSLPPAAFTALLAGRHETFLRSAYAAKNAVRYALPVYAQLRNSLAALGSRNFHE